MALSGTFSGTTANSRIKPTITWTAVQSVAGNYSDITATLTYSRTNTGYTTDGTWSGSITIGTQSFSAKKYIAVTYQSDTVAMTATARVHHDDYGALSVTISATGSINDSTLQDTVISKKVTLDTIPRASSIRAANAAIGSCATVVIARKNDSFTHTVAYSFGSLSGYMDAAGEPVDAPEKFSAVTVNFLLPESFYAQIPDAPSGVCRLTCCTYSGSTLIGEETADFTVTADPAVCSPTITGAAVDVNESTVALTGDAGKFVRFLSNALCTVEAAARHGASVAEIKVADMVITGNERLLEKVDTSQLQLQVTDTRGYTGSCTLELPLVPYVMLTNNAFVQRTDPTSGDAVLTLSGEGYGGSFGSVENVLTASCTVAGGEPVTVTLTPGADHRYFAQVPLQGLDYTCSHTLTVTVADSAVAVTKNLTVNRGIPVFDWGAEDFRFHVPVYVPALTLNGQSLADYIRTVVQS